MGMSIDAAGKSDVGRKRSDNEDFLLLAPEAGLYVVADGMGGRNGGAVAARLCAEILAEIMASGPDLSAARPDSTLSQSGNLLAAAVVQTNCRVHAASLDAPELRGMGSTLAAVWLREREVVAANVGDSPIFLIRGGLAEPLSVPHTVAGDLHALGVDPRQVADGKYLRMITRGMGLKPDVAPYVCETTLVPGDCLILCSDGLSNKVTPEEMRRAADEVRAEAACRSLVDLANARGGEDNISVIVVKTDRDNTAPSGFFSFLRRIFRR